MLRTILLIVVCGLCLVGEARVVFTTMDSADAFLCTGSPSNPELQGADLSGLNFGAAGALLVVPASNTNGEFQSILRFNLSNCPALFNSAYGSNHWTVSSISLELASNDGAADQQPMNLMFPVISGGNFGIAWLSDNDWAEGTGTPNMPTTDGVCFDSLSNLLAQPYDILGTNTYTPPGDYVPVTYTLPLDTNVVNEIYAGGEATFLLYAADDQIAYLFNSYNFGQGDQPLIHVTAIPLIKILFNTVTNGGFFFTGVGGDNATYQIQAATDLSTTNWQTIGTADTDANGNFQFLDSSMTNLCRRFYRIAE